MLQRFFSSHYDTRRKTAVDCTLFDETLRDGIQAPYVTSPPIEDKIRMLDYMTRIGIDAVDLGFPGASPTSLKDCTELAKYITSADYPIRPAFAGRAHPTDIDSICSVSQEAHCEVDAYVFVGISPIRRFVEDWSLDAVEQRIVTAAEQCRTGGVRFVLVLEDATRCPADVLSRIYAIAAALEVERITLCDTVGVSTTATTIELVRWSIDYFEHRGHKVGFDWHGHNDRGLALSNSLAAFEAGCDRLHGTTLGVGERAGNAAIDQIILTLALQYGLDFDLESTRAYCEYASEVLGVAIAPNYPGLGSDVFTTSAGVHAAAILKALRKGDQDLMDNVYSGVPASRLGRRPEVLIDAQSGAANVELWLVEHGLASSPAIIERILAVAKSSTRPLSTEIIGELVAEFDQALR